MRKGRIPLLKKIVSKIKLLFNPDPKGKSQSISSDDKKAVRPKQTTRSHKKEESNKHSGKPVRKHTGIEHKTKLQHNLKKNAVDQKKEFVIPDQWDSNLFNVPVAEDKIRFHDLAITNEILHSVFDLGFQYCTQVQAETLPRSLNGEDVTAQAQTGTGKTAAFLITIFNHLIKNPYQQKRKPGIPRSLILAPTRELVLQIEKDALGLGKYINASIISLLGGIDYKKQISKLKSIPCDILICTPGRLIDFMQKKLVDLGKVEILIIDEADRMLDMGFIPSVKKIVVSTPPKAKRQTMFFSATFTADVKRLAKSWTRDAFEITVEKEDVAVKSVEQITYITTIEEKPTLLYNLIMKKNLERVLVFVNRRDDAKKLKEKFESYGISCTLLSGDVEQTQRIKRLEKFREGKVRVLVATDVASRGIHVDAISHVINFNMPQDIEEYVHRIGRTGRAGASGISISFADENDSHEIQKLEDYLGKKIECTFPDEDLLASIPAEHQTKEEKIIENASRKKNYKGRRKRN